MGDQLVSSVVTVLVAIVGLAIIATLVSKNADTANIIGTGGSAFSGALQAAEGPVLGGFGLNVAGTSPSAGYHN
jgi:PRD1 phage membrane DNA delivery